MKKYDYSIYTMLCAVYIYNCWRYGCLSAIFAAEKITATHMALIKSISGIRGTIGGAPGSGLTPLDVVKFTTAYGAWVKQQSDNNKIVIGRDGRISGGMSCCNFFRRKYS